jgi:hypothetical protein
MKTTLTLTIASLLGIAFGAPAWADCAQRVAEAREAIKQAEGMREAREAQGYAEEAQMLAEKL